MCSQLSRTSGLRWDFLSAGFVPEGQFDPVPEAELVVDDSQVIFDDVFRGSDFIRDFAVLESLGDEFDDLVLSLAWNPVSVTSVRRG